MDPLPLETSEPSADQAPWGFEAFDVGEDLPEPGGQVIVGPWPARRLEVPYATWRQRALAALMDSAFFLPSVVATAYNTTIGMALLVAAVVFSGWQVSVLQGRTGQTIGKNRAGIFLVQEFDLRPLGARRAALRQLAHCIDAALLGVGFLWPLWDAKHQTFADQLFATVVVAG